MSSFGERLKKARITKGITQKELSQKLGVAQSTIANYEKNTRFPGNELLKEISEYLQVSLDFLMGIDLNDSSQYDYIEIDHDKIANEFLGMLLIGDSNKAKRIIKNNHDKGLDLLNMIIKVFIPTLIRIGDLWERNEISVAQEHYSSALIEKLLDYLSELEPVNEQRVFKALFMVPGGEEHTLSLKMAAEFFRRKGWSIIFIGRSIPLESLVRIVKDRKPDLLVLSVLTKAGSNSCGYLVQALKSELDSKKPYILVGGRGIDSKIEAIDLIGADFYIESLLDLKEEIIRIEEMI